LQGRCGQGRNEGGARGAHFPGRQNTMGHRMTVGALKSPNNITSIFFNTVNFLPKDLRFNSCPN